MIEHPCHGCQEGMHDEHIEYPEIPPEGVMGGWHCPCKGECAERAPQVEDQGHDFGPSGGDFCNLCGLPKSAHAPERSPEDPDRRTNEKI